MRWFTSICLFLGMSAMAGAHEISSDASLLTRLGHEVVGLHHLPFTALLIVAVLLSWRARRNSTARF